MEACLPACHCHHSLHPTHSSAHTHSRFVNVNLVLLQLEDVLERALTEAGYAPEDGSGCVHLFRTKVSRSVGD